MIQRINRKHEKTSSKKRGGFVYKERSADSVKKRAEQDGGRFDSIFKSGFDTFRPKVGSNCIRFLPPTWDDQDHYGLDIYVHGYIGPNKGSYLCLQKMKNKPCPICDLEAELRKGGEADDANKVAARKKVLTWIMDRDGDENTPTLYLMGWTVDRDISDLARNKRTGETLLIDHPDEGYDVTFTRKGNNLNTDYYGFAIDRSSSPIADKQKDQDTILEYIQDNPLPDVLKYVSAEKLQQVVDGVGEEPDEDDDEEERPKKKGRARDEDEDEDTEDEEDDADSKPARRRSRSADEDEDDDAEEDERPSRRGAKPRRSRSDDDADDDEDEDRPPAKKSRARDEDEDDAEEDEEEEAPRKRSKPGRRSRDEDEDEDSEDEESVEEDDEEASEEEDDEEEGAPKKKPVKRVSSKKPAPKDDDEDEEEQPRRKKPARRRSEDTDDED